VAFVRKSCRGQALIGAKAFSLKVYPELEMFAPFSPEENGIRGYPQGYGIRENALMCRFQPKAVKVFLDIRAGEPVEEIVGQGQVL